jgi:hypothetical protein
MPNGDKFEGSFLEDLFHGEGTYTYNDGKQISGIWRRGVIINDV